MNGISARKKRDILSKALAMSEENDAELLYLTMSGSTLYGTRVEGKSDLDARGLFLPKPASLILGRDERSLRFTSGELESRNHFNDVDIDLWSLQHWLLKLLPSGDTGATDLLFSPSNAACTIYKSSVLEAVFAEPLRLIDTKNGRVYAEYSMGQARKYGIKGSHLGALKSVWAFLAESCPSPSLDERLSDYLASILERCGDGKFCKPQEVHGAPGLSLCRKLHEGGTRMTEFKKRVESDMNRFGERAKEAEKNLGLDYKALSHALRALMQMEELLTTGRIEFPLKGREELIAVKMGKIPWNEIEERIVTMMDRVDALQENAPYAALPDADFAESCVLSCYGARGFPRGKSACKCRSRFDAGFGVSPATLNAILEKLIAAERMSGVTILYCCESGSRGWNFASRDSDFDVRFIYAHSKDWYLSVSPEEKTDTLDLGIEKTKNGELDINGWDIRKALKLLRKSNGPLLEWLSSPVVYRENPDFLEEIHSFAKFFFNPLSLWHHYRGLTEQSEALFEETPSIKRWFYVVRPLLCMKWIERGLGVPPMRFDRAVDAIINDNDVRREIFRLIKVKKYGGEEDEFVLSPTLREYTNILRSESIPPQAPGRRTVQPDLDEFFRKTLEEDFITCNTFATKF
jgi:predicted nucleotidyltransferase